MKTRRVPVGLAANIGAEAKAGAFHQIAADLEVSLAEAAHIYEVVLSAHQSHVVSRKAATFERAVGCWLQSAVLSAFPGAVYVKGAHSAGEITFASGAVLGVDVRWSGQAGGLSQILDEELTDLRNRYKDHKTRLLLVLGPGKAITDWMRNKNGLMIVKADDEESVAKVRHEIHFWLS